MIQEKVSLLRVHGLDAERYLQGRITQDVKSLKIKETKKSLILNPRGKIEGHFLIQKELDNSFLILADAGTNLEDFKEALLRFKVADQLELEPLEKEIYFTTENLDQDKYCVLTDKHGSFVALEKETKADFKLESDLETLRIQAGVPLINIELTDKISVADVPLDDLVSFNKGCYAGQEVVEMSIARGRANKKLIHGFVEGEVSSKDILDQDSAVVGFLTSKILQDGKTTLLGFHKNLDEITELRIDDKKIELL